MDQDNSSFDIETGCSGARVRRFRKWIEKSGGPVEELAREAEVLRWCLAQGLPVPEVLAYEPGLLRMSIMPGKELREIDALVEALRLIHAVPVEGCPFDASWPLRLEAAAARVEAGLVDAGDFDDENEGRSPEDILAELRSLPPLPDVRCFTHGDACIENFLADEQLTGIIDWGRAGVTHPAQDWALALRSVRDEFGEEAELRLRRHLPASCDDERLLWRFRLLDEMF